MIGIPSHLQPKIVVFFSVDLVGSTQYKQKQKRGEDAPGEKVWWEDLVNKFYIDFPKMLAETVRDLRDDHVIKAIHPVPADFRNFDFVLWKTNGDELIFRIELQKPESNSTQGEIATEIMILYYAVHCFAKCIYSCRLSLKLKAMGLDLKGAIWCSEFPVLNREIVVIHDASVFDKYPRDISDYQIETNYFLLEEYHKNPREMRQFIRIDYIGPQIDIGFRLCGLAKPSRLVISLEVAALLNQLGLQKEKLNPDDRDTLNQLFLPIKVREAVELKGALEKSRYPVFYVDFDAYIKHFQQTVRHAHRIADHASQIEGIHDRFFFEPGGQRSKIDTYCRDLLQMFRDYIMPPWFIMSFEENQLYSQKLAERAEDLKTYRETLKIDRPATEPDYESGATAGNVTNQINNSDLLIPHRKT
ncbi:MAG: hypothetical protein SF002_04385 [Alphaproteobacteria bacterium]|nr:hypothetical protein [Alphaproteobacteria bacterium]